MHWYIIKLVPCPKNSFEPSYCNFFIFSRFLKWCKLIWLNERVLFLSKLKNELWIRLAQILYISEFFLHNRFLNIWIHLVYKYCLVTILFREVIGKNVFLEIWKIRFYVWQKKTRPYAVPDERTDERTNLNL